MTTKLSGRLIVLVASLLLVLSAGAASWTGYGWWRDSQADTARDESLVVARRAVQGMFGYNFRTIDTQMPKVMEDMTSDFQEDWTKVTQTVLAPGAKEKELAVTATVIESGIISADADRAEVMIFLNQKSIGKDPSKGTFDSSRLRVKLENDNDRWLVADVDPI
ncbi:h domain protein [Nocardia sp. XZ_19_385]|uniref:h domain protein n=1 Tax=Nocardia sp. XZ_19_385 TaxID=2769488 RepID=UPI00188F309D|nr:h domain protein [Nocardia sp. XZ_19_385]